MLDKLFNPKSIAVIGASDEKGSVGHALMDNLINSDYGGTVYPVNVKRRHVHSIKAFNSVREVKEKIDLAIIATPAITVPGIVKECGEAGVGAVVIISAGFSETGRSGEAMIRGIIKTANEHNMRILGPNCLGFMRPDIHLNASFAVNMPIPGKIAFISQSGALGTAILDWSLKNNVGFRYFVSIGSMADITYHDLIDYFGNDKEVESILIYMESLIEARKFMSAARAFSRTKPIIVLKVGRSEAGAQAAKSHTGSITGNDAIFDAAFERAGIIRANTVVELFHTAKALAMQPRPKGKRLAVITNAGGPGIIATDALIEVGGRLAKLEKKTYSSLDKFLPKSWSRNNPIDILGDASPEMYKKTLAACLKDSNIDAILTILTPQSMTDPTAAAHALCGLNRKTDKTLMATWMGGNEVAEGRRILEKGNIPVYRQPEDAIKSFAHIFHYSEKLKTLHETPATIPHAFKPKTNANFELIERCINENREGMTEVEAKQLLKNYGIPIARHTVSTNAKEAGERAAKLGFPVVMKILSPDIFHKTDLGAVEININSKAEASEAYTRIINLVRKKEPGARIDGVFIEEQIKKRYELLIGSRQDPIFGPVIVFGMGGVAVEVFKDTKIGLPPLNMSLAMKIIESTKIYKLLKGYRNMPGVDIQSIQFLLYKFAYLVADFPEIKEIDINPFAVDEVGGIVLDAKVILDKKARKETSKPYSHLVISPYPKEYMYNYRMRNGKKVLIRPIRPEDEPLEAELFTKFSKETQRHRFFGLIKDISHELLQRYTQIDYDREIALIAEAVERGKKKMIGVVRLIGDPYNDTAEFAIVVGDPWQGQGLGNRFTDLILNIADERGYSKVVAKFYKDNSAMRHIFQKRGFIFKKLNRNNIHAELDLNN